MSELDQFLSLPEDPELALVEYENIIRHEMWRVILNDNVPESFKKDQMMGYVVKLKAFQEAHDVSLLPTFIVQRGDSFDSSFQEFLDLVTHKTTLIRAKYALKARANSTIIALPPHLKQQIHHHIGKIRETLESIDLPASKKEAIYKKLNALAEEIDRDRTRIEAAMALALELADTGGEVGKKLRPAQNFMEAITKLLAKGKEFAETIGLSAENKKALEAPRRQLPSPEEGETSQ